MRIASIEESKTLDIAIGEYYVIVDVNIRKAPSKDGKIIGKYQRGEKINVINYNKEWVQTDKGYIWGGYIVEKYNYNLNIHSDTEHSSLYMGQAYSIINNLEPKYINILKKYEIHLCSNPVESYNGTGDLPEDMSKKFLDGLTHIYKSQTVNEHLMYLCGSSNLRNTIYHELGHAIDYINIDTNEHIFSDEEIVQQAFKSENEAMQKISSVDFVIASPNEFFAEAFKLSMTNPDELKQIAPIIANYIEQVKAQIN